MSLRSRLASCGLGLAALGLLCCSAVAATIRVPTDYATIQAAIEAAADRDVIVVARGTYYERLVFGDATKTITVRSTNPDNLDVVNATIVDGGSGGTVASFQCHDGTTLSGLRLTHGKATYGGGVFCYQCAPKITKCVIAANSANYGGGLYCQGSAAELTANTFTGNSAAYGGGAYCYQSGATLSGNTFTSNSASASGTNAAGGGGLACYQSPATISGNTFNSNTATGSCGGGIYCHTSTATISANTLQSNTATTGAGLFCYYGSPAVSGNTIRSNTATGTSTNSALGGGLACSQSAATVSGNTIQNNAAGTGAGGGIGCNSCSPTISGNTISGNSARFGGGVQCYGGAAVLSANTISANSGTWGAGVYCGYECTATLSGNLVTGNTSSTGSGGGVYSYQASPSVLASTLSGNSAAYGGGLCSEESTVTVTNCIIANSTRGGGVARDGGTGPTVTYCDVYGNTNGAYVGGAAAGTGCLAVDPRFADAAAGDYRLKSAGGRWNGSAWVVDTVSSPCLDAGNPASAYSKEPSPNGKRVNLGYDGNTTKASKSPPTTVTKWSPTGTAVAVGANLVLRFSAAMARASVQGALCLNGVKVSGGTWTWAGSQATYNPPANLQPGTRYVAKVLKSARSTVGTPLAADFAWSFTTSAASPAGLVASAVPTASGARLTLTLAAPAEVTVSIRNLAGREVARLEPGALPAGVQTLLWNGRCRAGTRAPDGAYLLLLTARAADGSACSTVTSLRR